LCHGKKKKKRKKKKKKKKKKKLEYRYKTTLLIPFSLHSYVGRRGRKEENLG
jgi:cell division protein FtsB